MRLHYTEGNKIKSVDIPLSTIGEVFGLSGSAYDILTALNDKGYTYQDIIYKLRLSGYL